MSDIDTLLERVAQSCVDSENYAHLREIESALKAKLSPLLAAGQSLRHAGDSAFSISGKTAREMWDRAFEEASK